MRAPSAKNVCCFFSFHFLIGIASFLAPFLGAMAYCYYVLDWSPEAAKVAGVALSTTSLAVVYAVLVETLGASHAILPAFVFGLVLSKMFSANRLLQRRLRVVAFAFITPFFFINGGMNVSLKLLLANFGLLVQLLLVKQVTKIFGTYPLARKYVPKDAMYTTLLMSTGLTMGTISSVFGLQAGYVTQAQFSVIVAVVVLSAIIPTVIAQRWFQPKVEFIETKEIEQSVTLLNGEKNRRN